MRWFSFLLLFLISMASLPAASEADDLSIINAGFEVDVNRDGIPDGWMRKSSKTEGFVGLKSWVVDRRVSHSGVTSIRAGVADTNDVGVWEQGDIKIPAGTKHLRLTVWIKSENVRSSNAFVSMAFFNRHGKAIGKDVNAINVSSSREWTPYTGSAAVPEGATTVLLKCGMKFAFTKCGTFWFDDFHLSTSGEPFVARALYVDDNLLTEATPAEKKRGFILFERNYLRVLMKNAVPLKEECIPSLSIRACRGEYEPAVLTLHALRSLSDLEIYVSDLEGEGAVLKAGNIDVRAVRYMPKEGEGRWGLFQEPLIEEVPLILEKADQFNIEKNTNQTFWLTVHVPGTQASGIYTGKVTVRTSEAGSMSLPFVVTVYPFVLLPPPKGITFALYVQAWNNQEWINETFADMRAHGLNAIALVSDAPDMHIADGKVHVEWNGKSALEKYLAAYQSAGFTEPMLWLMGEEIPAICKKFGAIESEAFAQAYRDVITQIVRHCRESDWQEIIFQPVDEPFEWEQHLSEMLRICQLLKSVPGVRIENDGMNGKWENFSEEAYRLTDAINLHDGPLLDRHQPFNLGAWWKFYARAINDRKLIWFYNIDITSWHPEPVRFMSGFGLYKSRAHGIFPQAYMFSVNPEEPEAAYNSPASRTSWLMARFPATRNRSGGPTIAYEAFREGIDDYRYLVTLNETLDKAYRSGNQKIVEQANAIVEPVLAKIESATFNGCTGLAMQGSWTGKCEILPDGRRLIRGDHKIDNNWQFDDYDTLRHQIAEGIMQLQSLLAK